MFTYIYIYIGIHRQAARADIDEDNVPFARKFVNLFNFFSSAKPPTHVHRTHTYTPTHTHTHTCAGINHLAHTHKHVMLTLF